MNYFLLVVMDMSDEVIGIRELPNDAIWASPRSVELLHLSTWDSRVKNVTWLLGSSGIVYNNYLQC